MNGVGHLDGSDRLMGIGRPHTEVSEPFWRVNFLPSLLALLVMVTT